jgi:hypothetical protein
MFEEGPDFFAVAIGTVVGFQDRVSDDASLGDDLIRRVKTHLAYFAVKAREHSGIGIVFLKRVRVAARAPLDEIAIKLLPLLYLLDDPLGPRLDALGDP